MARETRHDQALRTSKLLFAEAQMTGFGKRKTGIGREVPRGEYAEDSYDRDLNMDDFDDGY